MRAELSYCVPLGIPYSKFLEWKPDDRDAALHFTHEMRTVCPSCGTRDTEWTEDRNAYVGQQRVCPGCEVLAQERRNVPEHMSDYVHVHLAPRNEARPPDEV